MTPAPLRTIVDFRAALALALKALRRDAETMPVRGEIAAELESEAGKLMEALEAALQPGEAVASDWCNNCHRPKSGQYTPVDMCGCASITYPTHPGATP